MEWIYGTTISNGHAGLQTEECDARNSACAFFFVSLHFPDAMRKPRLLTMLLQTRILWWKCLFWTIFLFADWHGIQYVSGHSCVNSLYSTCVGGGSHSFLVFFFWPLPLCRDNIRYDLGNVGRTTEKILERGFLDAVRLYAHLYHI